MLETCSLAPSNANLNKWAIRGLPGSPVHETVIRRNEALEVI